MTQYGPGFRQREVNPLVKIWNSSGWFIVSALVLTGAFIVHKRYKKGKMLTPKYTYRKAVKDIFKRKK